MTFEKLNDNVILVELSSDEMKKYKITYESLNDNNEDSQSAIKDLLSCIDKRKRIEKGEKVIVEVLPIEDGGCFFIFTFTPSIKKKYKIRTSEITSFFFMETLNNLLDFINVAKKNINEETNFTVYKMNGKFFVASSKSSNKLNTMLSEYGENVETINRNRVLEYGENLGKVYLQ